MIVDKTKKICPLSLSSKEPTHGIACKEGRCGWWLPASQECSIRAIGMKAYRDDVK